VFTAPYALSPYIKQIRFVFQGLRSLHEIECIIGILLICKRCVVTAYATNTKLYAPASLTWTNRPCYPWNMIVDRQRIGCRRFGEEKIFLLHPEMEPRSPGFPACSLVTASTEVRRLKLYKVPSSLLTIRRYVSGVHLSFSQIMHWLLSLIIQNAKVGFINLAYTNLWEYFSRLTNPVAPPSKW
jgi:hypothetical protein